MGWGGGECVVEVLLVPINDIVPLDEDEICEVFYDVLLYKLHEVLNSGFGNVEVFHFCHWVFMYGTSIFPCDGY